MKKLNYILFFIFIHTGVFYGQVGVGTTSPRAALEVSNTTGGGVLVPKYALSGSNDTSTVSNPNGFSLEVGTLVYNTTQVTGTNALAEGFVFWSGSSWTHIVPSTQLMMRRFTAGGIGGNGTVFNFPSESFNNISGASYSGTSITLPTGLYKVSSELRLNSNNTVDWQARLNGVAINGSIVGSTNPTTFNTNASEVQQLAIFEITAATGTLDFIVTGGVGASTLTNQCYVLIEKIN
ncbi:hypothetical protein GCM10011344_05470 [Dokdonia pacifica]|uniref:Uncharacterized protein n=1 Tax=Dokdonia pacifica TaxID=1627892 RepID=A0A238ZQ34_9FLAO|nr:hypothetical protein [Dokdonia pacifica]GGG07826.1 hypothetical protein GCM10011344_05470 [Dokdonia pacifica]SNR85299.1 hypothetical protein SAMN06265376_103414 [Dokdonia pacifica]